MTYKELLCSGPKLRVINNLNCPLQPLSVVLMDAFFIFDIFSVFFLYIVNSFLFYFLSSNDLLTLCWTACKCISKYSALLESQQSILALPRTAKQKNRFIIWLQTEVVLSNLEVLVVIDITTTTHSITWDCCHCLVSKRTSSSKVLLLPLQELVYQY